MALGFGGREALQAAPSVVCPGALPCLGEQFRFGEAVPAGAGPPCRPGSARTRSTATRCALQRRAQFFHGAKDPRRTRALYACPRAPLFAPRRSSPPRVPAAPATHPRAAAPAPSQLHTGSTARAIMADLQPSWCSGAIQPVQADAARMLGGAVLRDCRERAALRAGLRPDVVGHHAGRHVRSSSAPAVAADTRTKQPRCRLAGSSRRTASTTWPGAR